MQQAQVETLSEKRLSWLNVSFLTLSPVVAITALSWYIYEHGFQLTDLIAFFVMYTLTGIAMTAGYHRYYSHRAYQCHPLVQLFYLIFGAAAFQNNIINWVSDHRYHHRYVDREEDPYNINKGFFWAHIGWVFYQDPPNSRPYSNAKDLKKDKLVAWQSRYYWQIGILVSILIPLLIGVATDRPGAAILWGGLFRIVWVHQVIFMINSAAHYFGTQPYSTRNSARDSTWLAVLSFGEGYHNYHHAFPSDFRNGIAWYHWDPTKWWIQMLSRAGLTWNLMRVSDQAIEKAKMSVLKDQPSSPRAQTTTPLHADLSHPLENF